MLILAFIPLIKDYRTDSSSLSGENYVWRSQWVGSSRNLNIHSLMPKNCLFCWFFFFFFPLIKKMFTRLRQALIFYVCILLLELPPTSYVPAVTISKGHSLILLYLILKATSFQSFTSMNNSPQMHTEMSM